MIIDDAAHGDYYALYGILDYLTTECGISIERIIVFANNTLQIPPAVTVNTLEQLSIIKVQ